MPRNPETGLAFVSVLATISIGAVVLLGMINRQGTLGADAFDQLSHVQARLIAQGALHSAQVALERDGRTAPDRDHYAEPWHLIEQQPLRIERGSLSLQIEDLGGRINLNALNAPGSDRIDLLTRTLREIEIDPALGPRIANFIAERGPLTHLSQLAALQLNPQAFARLDTVATLLPEPHPLNLNTAPPPVIRALFPQSGAARRLLALRDKTKQVTASDLQSLGLLRPHDTGWTTRSLRATATVEREGITLTLSADYQRQARDPGVVTPYRHALRGTP